MSGQHQQSRELRANEQAIHHSTLDITKHHGSLTDSFIEIVKALDDSLPIPNTAAQTSVQHTMPPSTGGRSALHVPGGTTAAMPAPAGGLSISDISRTLVHDLIFSRTSAAPSGNAAVSSIASIPGWTEMIGNSSIWNQLTLPTNAPPNDVAPSRLPISTPKQQDPADQATRADPAVSSPSSEGYSDSEGPFSPGAKRSGRSNAKKSSREAPETKVNVRPDIHAAFHQHVESMLQGMPQRRGVKQRSSRPPRMADAKIVAAVCQRMADICEQEPDQQVAATAAFKEYLETRKPCPSKERKGMRTSASIVSTLYGLLSPPNDKRYNGIMFEFLVMAAIGRIPIFPALLTPELLSSMASGSAPAACYREDSDAPANSSHGPRLSHPGGNMTRHASRSSAPESSTPPSTAMYVGSAPGMDTAPQCSHATSQPPRASDIFKRPATDQVGLPAAAPLQINPIDRPLATAQRTFSSGFPEATSSQFMPREQQTANGRQGMLLGDLLAPASRANPTPRLNFGEFQTSRSHASLAALNDVMSDSLRRASEPSAATTNKLPEAVRAACETTQLGDRASLEVRALFQPRKASRTLQSLYSLDEAPGESGAGAASAGLFPITSSQPADQSGRHSGAALPSDLAAANKRMFGSLPGPLIVPPPSSPSKRLRAAAASSRTLPSDPEWQANFERLQKFVELRRMIPESGALGEWVSSQRQAALRFIACCAADLDASDSLSSSKFAQLMTLAAFQDDVSSAELKEFNDRMGDLERFVDSRGRLPSALAGNDTQTDQAEVDLAQWSAVQKRQALRLAAGEAWCGGMKTERVKRLCQVAGWMD